MCADILQIFLDVPVFWKTRNWLSLLQQALRANSVEGSNDRGKDNFTNEYELDYFYSPQVSRTV